MDFTKTIIPLALMASWAIDSKPFRALGIIVKYQPRGVVMTVHMRTVISTELDQATMDSSFGLVMPRHDGIADNVKATGLL